MRETELPPESPEILERIRSVRRAKPRIDLDGAASALRKHLVAADLFALPVRWAWTVEDGFDLAERSHEVMDWRVIEAATSMQVWGVPRIDLEETVATRPWTTRRAIFEAAWDPRERALLRVARRVAVDELRQPDSPRSAGLSAAMASAWVPDMKRHRAIWQPMLDAFECGLWVFWVQAKGIVAVPRPEIVGEGNELHSANGPAVRWADGTGWWFWHGVNIREEVLEPKNLTIGRIHRERNVEIWRVLIDRYGVARYLEDAGAQVVSADSFGALYQVRHPDGVRLDFVRVKNATPEPDGSRKEYFLSVPPGMTTAREAVAWTFGLREMEYNPREET